MGPSQSDNDPLSSQIRTSASGCLILFRSRAQLSGRDIDAEEVGGDGCEEIAVGGRHVEIIQTHQVAFVVDATGDEEAAGELAEAIHGGVEIVRAVAVKPRLDDAFGSIGTDDEDAVGE